MGEFVFVDSKPLAVSDSFISFFVTVLIQFLLFSWITFLACNVSRSARDHLPTDSSPSLSMQVSLMESGQRVKCGLLVESITGPTRATSALTWARSGLSLLLAALTPRALCWKRCKCAMRLFTFRQYGWFWRAQSKVPFVNLTVVSSPSSLTLLCGSAFVCNWLRTARRLQLSSLTTVAWTSSMRTTR